MRKGGVSQNYVKEQSKEADKARKQALLAELMQTGDMAMGGPAKLNDDSQEEEDEEDDEESDPSEKESKSEKSQEEEQAVVT